MTELLAYSTAAVTLGLVVARPRLGLHFRLTPALAAWAGVLVMFALGLVTPAHALLAISNLWSSFVAIASIMVMTEAARRAGLLEWWASLIEARAHSTASLFFLVFSLGVLTSALFNNDAAILLLTPVIVHLVRRRYPGRPELLAPFAFAVFMSAGVAPLPVSNPMNMVVASYLQVPFADYVLAMLPIAAVGWVIAFGVLRLLYARTLEAPWNPEPPRPVRAGPLQHQLMILLLAVLVSYPLLGALGWPVWRVALLGALGALALLHHHRRRAPLSLIVEGISFDTLAFLMAVLVMSLGLRDAGLVGRLSALYEGAGPGIVGLSSALGSAVLNNHPMSYLNMMALSATGQPPAAQVFAALVGGDLGPRLLPMGSLAGLLWLEMLRRESVKVGVGRFVGVGAAVGIPTIAVSLFLLALP